jgi:hypothetical protein
VEIAVPSFFIASAVIGGYSFVPASLVIVEGLCAAMAATHLLYQFAVIKSPEETLHPLAVSVPF